MSSTLPQPNDCCNLCNGQTVTIDTGGTGTGSGIIVASTLAALRAVQSSTLTVNSVALLLGNTAMYDFGPAKTYYWDATNTSADAPYSVVIPNDTPPANPGRWIQVQ